MERLRKCLCIIGWIALFMFAFARTLGIEEWRWMAMSVGVLCAIALLLVEYKSRKGIFAEGHSKTNVVIYVVSMLLLMVACVIHIAKGGEATNLVLLALLIYLGVLGRLALRRKSNG